MRGPPLKTQILVRGLRKLLPDSFSHLIKLESSTKYASEFRIICLFPETAVPQPSSKVFRIDFLADDKMTIKWSGDLPSKLPDLLQKIVKAFDEGLFNNEVLEKQLKVLLQEWKK